MTEERKLDLQMNVLECCRVIQQNVKNRACSVTREEVEHAYEVLRKKLDKWCEFRYPESMITPERLSSTREHLMNCDAAIRQLIVATVMLHELVHYESNEE